MKPRNDFEKELQRIIDGRRLHPLTQKQMEQGLRIMDKQPKFKVFVMSTEQTVNGMKLTKCYKVHKYGKGHRMAFFNLVLIKAQRGEEVVWAARNRYMGVVDSFSHEGQLTIKDECFFYDDYVRSAWPLLSAGKISEPYAVIMRRSLNAYMFCDSRIETLYKSREAHDYELLEHIISTEKALTDYVWAAYKVAKRHGYNFQGEMWRWVSLVNMLKVNKMDYRNPVFICPANLFEAYQNLIDINDRRLHRATQRRNELAEQHRLEEERARLKEAESYNPTYVKQHKKWLGVVIVRRGITIKPLQSIAEFLEEGHAMHHCVYRNGYYKKKDSLILSAKDDEGNRLATIEWDLARKAILQCRAAHNAQPQQDRKIRDMILKSALNAGEKNMRSRVKKVV